MTRWLISLSAVAGYAALWVGYVHGWGWLVTVDGAALDAGHRIGMKYPAWVPFWDGVSTIFEPTMFRVLAMVAAILTLVQRRLRAALFALVTVEPVSLITHAAKELADRPRPLTAMAATSSSAFPSGHALAAIVGVAALLAVVWPLLHGRARTVAVGIGVLVVLAVGVARVALNVHHPSDVLAGWALGWLYFAVWAALLKPWADGG